MNPRSNLNNDKEDPVTELGFSLGYSTVCSRTFVRNDPSAGANAGSLSFVAAKPVSELVWSPEGLTLRYADRNLVGRQSSRFLGMGPSNMGISTSQAEKVDHTFIESTNGGMVTPEGKDPTNEANANKVAPNDGDFRNKDKSSNCSVHDQAEITSKPREKTSSAFPGRDVGRTNELLQNEPDPEDCDSHVKASGCSSKKQVMEVPLDASLLPMHKDNNINGGIRSHLMVDDQAVNISVPLSEKLESMDENDVREPYNPVAGETRMKCAASESFSEVKSESMHGTQNHLEKLIPPCNNPSPDDSRVLENHSLDKGRPSFDVDADVRLLKDSNDSRDSVESCNRAMVAKKRWRVDQPLFIGSKRAKQIHNVPSSSGFSTQNSSFMNWISNMMKGLSRPTIDAGAPLSFAFADPSTTSENVIRTNMSEQNVGYTGFKSFFQKIYQPDQHAQEMRFPDTSNEARIGSSSAVGTDDVRKQLLLSNKEFNKDTSVVGSGPSSLPLEIHGHVSVYKGESRAYSCEDKVLVNKDALIMSTSSVSEKKTTMADSTEEKALVNKDALIMSTSSTSEQKTPMANSMKEKAPQFGCGGDSGTFWINHLSSKAPSSSLKLDKAAQGFGGATDSCPNSGRTLVQSTRSCGSEKNVVNASSNEHHNERPLGTAGNELPNCHANAREIDVMLPSKHLKRSEEIASTFARRLDALRHNIPQKSNGDDKPNVPCFFCGMMGHQLRVCTKVEKSDHKGFLTASHPREASHLSPTCIKCFQLNHWAVSCPHKQVQHNDRDGFGFWVRHGFSKAESVQDEPTLVKSCHAKGNEYSKQKVVSNSGTLIRAREDEDVSTGTNQKDQTEIRVGCALIMEKISGVSKGIFDMIRMLRLSRSDILKWTNSGASPIHLDGYFLRLRLGKWGDGLGGSGYCVACINGMTQVDRFSGNGKTFVSVNVGGVKCLVGSQYISNHDFIEDELKAWWGTTSKGGKMPSEDELRYKVEERRRLVI